MALTCSSGAALPSRSLETITQSPCIFSRSFLASLAASVPSSRPAATSSNCGVMAYLLERKWANQDEHTKREDGGNEKCGEAMRTFSDLDIAFLLEGSRMVS